MTEQSCWYRGCPVSRDEGHNLPPVGSLQRPTILSISHSRQCVKTGRTEPAQPLLGSVLLCPARLPARSWRVVLPPQSHDHALFIQLDIVPIQDFASGKRADHLGCRCQPDRERAQSARLFGAIDHAVERVAPKCVQPLARVQRSFGEGITSATGRASGPNVAWPWR